MKKILISLGIIGVVAVIAIGATIAYFNDTETSAGNIFVAGSMDLKVDHTRQTYNGVDCETCSVNVYSSTATKVISGTGAFVGSYPSNAVGLTFIHPNWLQQISDSDAKWIWVTNPVLQADTTNGAEYTFQKKFNWNGSIVGITLDLALAADNGYKIVFNGVTVADQLGTENNFAALVNTSGAEALMLNEVQNGENTLEITVRNKPGSSNPASNPAGLIFDLTVQRPSGECEADSAFQQACRLWGPKDLEEGDVFWNFDDVKPGDYGINVISLHVYDNDAYACLMAHNIVDLENELTDPEVKAGDDTPVVGELSQFIKLFAWEDNGDGVYNDGDPIIVGPNSPFATAIGVINLTALNTKYVGIAWCVGTQSVDGDVVSCDGSTVSNVAQTDRTIADFTAYAEQQRNNAGFVCPNWNQQ